MWSDYHFGNVFHFIIRGSNYLKIDTYSLTLILIYWMVFILIMK